jgi:hypothetical protein
MIQVLKMHSIGERWRGRGSYNTAIILKFNIISKFDIIYFFVPLDNSHEYFFRLV